MPPLPLHSVPLWHVIGETLNCTCPNKTFVIPIVRHLGKLNIRKKCVNNASIGVRNSKMERERL